MDFEKLLLGLGQARTGVIKSYLAMHSLDPDVVSQILNISNIARGSEREMGGSILLDGNDIIFKLVPSITYELETYLDQVKSGNYSNADKLYEYGHEIMKKHAEYMPPSNLDMIVLATCDMVLEVLSSDDPSSKERVGSDLLEHVVSGYQKLILDRSYSAEWRSLGRDKKGFLGMFHTHNDGLPPSPGDILISKENIEVPSLVISSQDYDKAKIYLVSDGNIVYEKIIQKQ